MITPRERFEAANLEAAKTGSLRPYIEAIVAAEREAEARTWEACRSRLEEIWPGTPEGGWFRGFLESLTAKAKKLREAKP